MKLLKGLTDKLTGTIGYLAEGALEVFSPDHDSPPPEIGTQSYSGEDYHPSKKDHYGEPVAKVTKP